MLKKFISIKFYLSLLSVIYKFIFIAFLIIFISINVFPANRSKTVWKKNANDFRLDSVAKDILKADYNQLQSMAMSLGLKEESDASAYRKALADYYGIKLFEDKVVNKAGNKIVLERAGELKMIKVVEEDEDNLHILGRVRLILETGDNDKKVKKTIEADEVMINTKKKEIAGIGSIIFKDEKLEYEGEQFYYDYNINRGVLFAGRTQLLKGGDSGLDGAFFKGERVVQSGKDDIILYNGMLTTCKESNPHYYMKVSRLWVSEEGEWGLLNGVVYVGPVPFFYFPVYYHPKELIVNPSFGFRAREGWYLNTTYYVLGKKSGDLTTDASSSGTTSSSSSTSTTSTTSATVLINRMRQAPTNLFHFSKMDIDGKLDDFYNKNDFYKEHPRLKFYPELTALDFSLKFFGDAYTNLGFFLGFYYYMNAVIPNYPFKLYWLSDYGFSRKIWKETGSGLYVPYDPVDLVAAQSGSVTDLSQNTFLNIGSNPLLPRMSQWFKFTGSLLKNYVSWNYEIQLEYASDKSYFTDFYNRSLDFSYFDLLADAISYGVQSQSDEFSGIQAKEEESLSADYEHTTTYIKTDFAPTSDKYPDLFGLKPISSIKVDLESKLDFLATTVSDYSSTENDVQDPRKDRYLLNSFTAPNLTYTMSGTLLDYNTFLGMPEKARLYNSNRKNKDVAQKDNAKKDLYLYIDSIKNTDASSDSNELDYKLLLPLFSKKVSASRISRNRLDYKYDKILAGDEDFSYKNNLADDSEEDEYVFNYDKLSMVDPELKTTTSQTINALNFSLKYSITDTLNNEFEFDTVSVDPAYDTVQMLFNNKLDPADIIESFNINNLLKLKLNGSLSFLEISGSPIWKMSPEFNLSYQHDWDNLAIYEAYLSRLSDSTADDLAIGGKLVDVLEDNWAKTELYLTYNDSVVNDLSFGIYRISGTKITTTLALDIFKYNEAKKHNFDELNTMNSYNSDYEEYSDTNLYFNRVAYDRITKLETVFNMQFNLLPQGNAHSLDMALAPKINWIVPSTDLSTLKTELWNDESDDVIWNTDVQTEAKEYIYYRLGGKPNLLTKVSEFYKYENFWSGPKYFRKMFENITYSLNYNYKFNNIKVVSISNSLIFELDNIGKFSNLSGFDSSYSVYPNDTFTISIFDSILSYKMIIDFSKENNTTLFSGLTTDDWKLDEYKIMTMSNSHTLTTKIPGQLFNAKLPKGDWLSFSSSTVFKWDRTFSDTTDDQVVSSWGDRSDYNYFYLDSQVLSLKLLMDIFTFKLTFKKFNFVDTGYGFELDNGTITIGYNITEIPVFFRFFKLTLHPSASYTFTVRHNSYIDGSTTRQYNSDYYTNNILTLSFAVDLIIGQNEDFETVIHFGISSENKKMYNYYIDTAEKSGLELFFEDLGNSFRFDDISLRRDSPFNLKSVDFSVTHKLCDWLLVFKYTGAPIKDSDTQKYTWDNTFEFSVTWAIDTKNQLMKMFNKANINEVYKEGQWEQPILSIDPNE